MHPFSPFHTHMMKILTGLRDAESIRRAIQDGAEYIGLVFNDRSPLNVSMLPTHTGIIPDKAPDVTLPASDAAVTDGLGAKKVHFIGIFTDEMPQNIVTRVVNFRLDMVLFDGHESPTVLRSLRRTLGPVAPTADETQYVRPGVRFIKSLRIASEHDFQLCRDFDGIVDFYQFYLDETADFSLLKSYKGNIPYFLP